jgi:hypothetical protein
MKKIFILLILVSSQLYADECSNCTPELKPFVEVIKNVEALSAITEINCNDVLKKNAKSEYQDLYGKLPIEHKKIKGINLQGSQLELNYLTSMLGDNPNDAWKLTKDCKTVLCALTKMYDSEEAAERTLNIAKRDGYIVSVNKNFKDDKGAPIGQLFSINELRDIDLAYKNLPPGYKKLKTLEKLFRLPTGYESPLGPDVAAYAGPGIHINTKNFVFNKDGEITFIDGAFNESDKSWGPLVAVHELSHHFDYSSTKEVSHGISESQEYLQISGWVKSKKYKSDSKTGNKTLQDDWKHSKDKNFVSNYAGTQPAEDFAESCAYYIFHSQKFKAIDPIKYNFIKNRVFKGKEYDNLIDLPITKKDLITECLNDSSEYRIYSKLPDLSTNIHSYCLTNYLNNFKDTDPKTCEFNSKQRNNYLKDKIEKDIKYLNNLISELAKKISPLIATCTEEKNFQNNCPVKKFFEQNTLDGKKLDLSDEDTKKIQELLIEKIRPLYFGSMYNESVINIVSQMGKNNFIADSLINGLSDKDKIVDQYPLNRQKNFLDNALDGFMKKLDTEGYKLDSKQDFKQMSQTYLMLDKDTSKALNSFQEDVFKKATRSKDKNLKLIQDWATSQEIENTPKFDELAESLRKYGSFWK